MVLQVPHIIIEPTLWNGWESVQRYSESDNNDAIISDLEWMPAVLVIYDSICGGSKCSVTIQFGKNNTHTFLKSVEHLYHSDFEDLFGIDPDNFIPGRIISVLSTHIDIEQE